MPILLKDIASAEKPELLVGVELIGPPNPERLREVKLKFIKVMPLGIGKSFPRILVKFKISYETPLTPTGILDLYGEWEVDQKEMMKVHASEEAVELLHTLHKFNVLNERIVKIIGLIFKIDALAICREEGITYNK